MAESVGDKWIWKFIYKVWPPILRVLEKVRFHNSRQEFLLGYLNKKYDKSDLRKFLVSEGFEDAILTWKDPGEILGMRKVDKKVFQYHVRLFYDGEIRGHHEYSSEGSPWNHCIEKGFKASNDYFDDLLEDFLSKSRTT
jgi:hypothetical protein